MYCYDCAETKERASIIGDQLKLRLYISTEICTSSFSCCDRLRKGNRDQIVSNSGENEFEDIQV